MQTTDQERWVTVRHVHGHDRMPDRLLVAEPCGGIAFTYNDPRPLDQFLASRMRYPDGSQGQPLDILRCGTCGKPIHLINTDIDEHYR